MQEDRYIDLSDQELIELIRKDDKEAMDFLLEKYKNLVRKKANRVYLIGGDKDDLIQEGMIGLYKAIRDFESDKDSSFYSFADLCINRQICTAIKLSNRKKNIPLNHYISLNSPGVGENENESGRVCFMDLFFSNSQNPEELVIDKERVGMIEYELGRCLSSFEKSVLDLYLGGQSYLEIARQMNKKPKSIDNALQRIKTKLSHLLTNE